MEIISLLRSSYAVCRACRNSQHGLSRLLGVNRRLPLATHNQSQRWFGQPAAQTHPHLLQEGHVTPGIMKEEYSLRRHRLMENISKRCPPSHSGSIIVIIPSAPKVYMSQDIPYPFRQNTDFLYLCGFQEPNSVLVLESSKGSSLPDHTSTLFVPKKDPLKELWDGPRSGIDGAVTLTGVEEALNVDDFGRYLEDYSRNNRTFATWYDYTTPSHIEYHLKFLSTFVKDVKNCSTESPRNLIHALRVVKSAAEADLMRRTCEIASQSFREVMKFSRPEVNESHLYAKMDFECRIRGAEYLAYPPVVAGGNRANTIHYVANNQLIHEGEMVLMDAGCECHGYTSDITRTWPVNGKFSSWQRELYEALLETQELCVQLVQPNVVTMDQLYLEMLALIGRQLQRLGIVPKHIAGPQLNSVVRQFCPHHVSHYLGMDVHDTDEMPRSQLLQPGMVVTVEPGIYIPETCNYISKELRGVGIRIEDDVLVTSDGPINLCASCPKQPNDIEKLMN